MKEIIMLGSALVLGLSSEMYHNDNKKVIEVKNNVVDEIKIEEVKKETKEEEKKEKKELSIEDKIKLAFGDEGELALSIAKAESGLNPKAMNTNIKTGDYSIGLFQINLLGNLFEGRYKRAVYLGYKGEKTREALTEWLKDADNNIKFAKSLRETSGWSQWSTYKRGEHLKFKK